MSQHTLRVPLTTTPRVHCSPYAGFPCSWGLQFSLVESILKARGGCLLTQPQAIRLSLTGFGKAETLRDPGRILCLISRLLLYTGKSQRGYSSPQQGPSLSFWERPRCGEAICPSALAVAAAAHPSLCAWGKLRSQWPRPLPLGAKERDVTGKLLAVGPFPIPPSNRWVDCPSLQALLSAVSHVGTLRAAWQFLLTAPPGPGSGKERRGEPGAVTQGGQGRQVHSLPFWTLRRCPEEPRGQFEASSPGPILHRSLLAVTPGEK